MSIVIHGLFLPKDRELRLRIDENGEVYVYGSYPTELYKAVDLSISITPEEFEKEMIVLRESCNDDPEKFHGAADDFICKVMRELGYGAGIDIFENHEKWYS